MNSKFAIISFLDGGGGSIDNTLPGSPVYPTGGPVLPPGGALLPVYPFDPTRPDNSLPPSSGRPDNSLPGSQPGVDNTLPSGGHVSGQPIVPGKRFIVKWLACSGLILVPDNELPATPEPK
jgi:hypothetical protein